MGNHTDTDLNKERYRYIQKARQFDLLWELLQTQLRINLETGEVLTLEDLEAMFKAQNPYPTEQLENNKEVTK